MESIIISSKDISKLIVNNYLTVTEDKVVELYNDNFILNCNGVIYNIHSINMQFVKQEIDNIFVIEYLRNLICEHLNLKHNEVIFSMRKDDEIEFIIRFAPVKECKIIVCEYRRALQNTLSISDSSVTVK